VPPYNRRLTAYHNARIEYRRDRFRVHGLAKNVGFIKCGLPYEQPPPRGVRRDGGGGNCDPSYVPCARRFPPDLNCPQIAKEVTVVGPDVHRLDGDGDGTGCDGW
jgi:hypothetical protein